MASDWMPFESAVVGALVGGGLSLLGSHLATRKAVESATKLAVAEHQQREEKERRASVSAVLAEIRAILRVVQEPATMTMNTLVTFSMDVWKSSKEAIAFVGPEVEHVIQDA
ncbi:hypothetical protein ACFLWB_02000 [Chloroflexota bacterium]